MSTTEQVADTPRRVPDYVKSPRFMAASNQPDLAVGQDWMHDLDAYVRASGLKGHDPFDVKAHPIIRRAQPHALPRKVTSVLCDLFPRLSRRLLRIAPTENPKAHALMALGRLRMFELTGAEDYLHEARENLDWLLAHTVPGCHGACWGYPFRVFARGVDCPPDTPMLVVSAIAGQAFLEAHRLTGEQRWLDTAVSIAQFIIRDLPRREGAEGAFCFGYGPPDARRVHNANLLGAEMLFRTAAVTGDETLESTGEAALRFTLGHQRVDGSWLYGVWEEGEPYDRANLEMIDHHHTGFVLRSLQGINAVHPDAIVEKALAHGYAYYRKHLYGPYGVPVTAAGRYPVDIHACAESVLCPSVLSSWRRGTLEMATLGLRWTHWYLRRKDGAPYYRKYPFFTSRIVFPRWGVAWMYLAMAEYLFAMSRAGEAGHSSIKTW